MNTEDKTKEFMDLYKIIFHEEADALKMKILIDEYGEEKVESVLHYYIIHAPKPPAENKKFNPFGLLYKVCRDWKI